MITHSKKLGLLFAVAVVLTPAVIYAANLTIPNTFTSGTPIQSAQVNANFTAVQTAVNAKQDANSPFTVPGAPRTASGTASGTAGAMSLTGLGTGFLGQVEAGYLVSISSTCISGAGGEVKTVTSVAANTSLTVDSAWS